MREINLVPTEVSRTVWMKKYNKEYRLKHSQEISCLCGSVHRAFSKYSHSKSKMHNNFLAKNNNGNAADECRANQHRSGIDLSTVENIKDSIR